jgi:hypothetical protein
MNERGQQFSGGVDKLDAQQVSGKGYHLAVILLLGALLVVWWGGLAWLIWYLIFD